MLLPLVLYRTGDGNILTWNDHTRYNNQHVCLFVSFFSVFLLEPETLNQLIQLIRQLIIRSFLYPGINKQQSNTQTLTGEGWGGGGGITRTIQIIVQP